jgi:hypothetical protein
VQVGSTSAPAPITITNEGFVNATVSLVGAPPGFAVGGLPATLAPGAATALPTTFSPSTTGPGGGNVTLHVASAAGAGTSSFVVSGTGVPPGTSIGAPFSALPPTRILDTREAGQPIGPGEVRTVRVAGVKNVPLNAGAVVMNVTVFGSTSIRDDSKRALSKKKGHLFSAGKLWQLGR